MAVRLAFPSPSFIKLHKLVRFGIATAVLCLAEVTPLAHAQDARWYQLSEQVVQLQEQGKISEAMPIAQQAVNAAQSAYGPADRHLALSLNVLGVLLTDQEKFAEAETSLQRALAIFTKTTGAESADAATVLANLGNLSRLEGHYPDA